MQTGWLVLLMALALPGACRHTPEHHPSPDSSRLGHTVTERWEGRAWTLSERTLFEYDGAETPALELQQRREGDAWVDELRVTNELDADGRPASASRAEVFEAARIAGLEDDLELLPQGLDTLVGERGVTLSGGQRQRVALARAVLRRPRLLLLDDCLSAVDTRTEETILGNLASVFAGRTVFLVAHRVSTVRQADQIVVLDEGRIVERGDHRQLLAAGGAYAELARLQRLEEELAAVS